jgi:hypothetical protein
MYNIVFHIKTSQRLEPPEISFLSLLLLNSKFSDNFNLNRSLIDLSFTTKVKKRFSGNKSNSEMLVFYQSPNEITRVKSDLIDILDSVKDKGQYGRLVQNEDFIVIGNLRPAKLTHGQAHYINKLISSSKYAVNIISPQKSNKSEPQPCNHYKNFTSEKFKR